jgi:predicted ArsR family transcriptional regulator
MRKKGPDIKNQILGLLGKNGGLTITEIAHNLAVHHITASKYLAVLEAEKRVMHRGIGMAKVFKTV